MHTAPRLAAACALTALAACSSTPANEAPPPAAEVSARSGLERVLAVVGANSADDTGWELMQAEAQCVHDLSVVQLDVDVTGADAAQVDARFDSLMAALRALEGVRSVSLSRTTPIDPTRLAVSGLVVGFESAPPLAYQGSNEEREAESVLRALAVRPDVRLGAVAISRERDGARLRIRAGEPRDGGRVEDLKRFLDGIEREVRGARVVSVSLRPAWAVRDERTPSPRRYLWQVDVDREPEPEPRNSTDA